jgi:hypothetical protein
VLRIDWPGGRIRLAAGEIPVGGEWIGEPVQYTAAEGGRTGYRLVAEARQATEEFRQRRSVVRLSLTLWLARSQLEFGRRHRSEV